MSASSTSSLLARRLTPAYASGMDAEEDGAGPSVVVVESDSAGPSATVTEVRNMVRNIGSVGARDVPFH